MPSNVVTPVPSAAASPGDSPPSDSPPAAPAAADRPLAASGSIAVAHQDGSLWLIDARGRATILADAADGAYGFPTWSPDGSRIAAVRTSPIDTAVVVFDASRATTGRSADPTPIFRSATVAPFYLSWTPDGKTVSFLASDSDGLALRIAPADAHAPLDGSGPGAVIRAGSPFYYDWIDSTRMLAHIGDGAEAFLGEIGTGGAAAAPALKAPGTFRSADVSGDGAFDGYVRAGETGEDAVVVAARDGSGEHSMPVYGAAAVDFSPTDDTLAAIGSTVAVGAPLGIPIGPLRLMDAHTGATRTLLDGAVVSFSWSPDGRTIAAMRLVPAAGGSNVSFTGAAASPAPTGPHDVRLAFVDVASGRIRSQPRVLPGTRYVNALLTYFDQYALSHRLWAPDSSSFLLPQTGPGGSTHVDVMFPDGGDPVSFDGEIGFWSP